MSASDYPKDENLRLVLSVGHEEWLQAKRVEARKYLRAPRRIPYFSEVG